MEMVNSGYLVPYQKVEKIEEVREKLKEMGLYFEMSLSVKGIYFDVWYGDDVQKSEMDSIMRGLIS